MCEVTRLLDAAANGDRRAAADLLPLVYEELRALAAARMAAEAPGHTLNPTALVHEAYIRLVGAGVWSGRTHFMAAAAVAIRRVLVDHARTRRAAKRGGGAPRVPLPDEGPPAPEPDADLLALDEALEKLAAHDPLKARLVELRYFAGLTGDEAAAALGVSPATADRHWAFARAWLLAEMGGGHFS